MKRQKNQKPQNYSTIQLPQIKESEYEQYKEENDKRSIEERVREYKEIKEKNKEIQKGEIKEEQFQEIKLNERKMNYIIKSIQRDQKREKDKKEREQYMNDPQREEKVELMIMKMRAYYNPEIKRQLQEMESKNSDIKKIIYDSIERNKQYQLQEVMKQIIDIEKIKEQISQQQRQKLQGRKGQQIFKQILSDNNIQYEEIIKSQRVNGEARKVQYIIFK